MPFSFLELLTLDVSVHLLHKNTKANHRHIIIHSLFTLPYSSLPGKQEDQTYSQGRIQ